MLVGKVGGRYDSIVTHPLHSRVANNINKEGWLMEMMKYGLREKRNGVMVMIDHFKEKDGSIVYSLEQYEKVEHGETDNTEFLPIWLVDNYKMAYNILHNPAKDGEHTYHDNPWHCLNPAHFEVVQVKLVIGGIGIS